MRILFVCRSNRGRSQMAAALFNKYSHFGHADSAGTIVKTPGDTLHARAQVSVPAGYVITLMQEEGIDISQNVQTQVTQNMLDTYDKVIVMAEHETIPEWLRSNPKFEYWEIEDPYWKELDGVRQTREDIKRHVLKLIKEN